MRSSAFVIGLVAFVVVIAGGVGISWYGQASAAKQGIEQIIAKINGNGKYITYDAIETSGFPETVNVSIIKPHFKGRLDQLLQNIIPPDPATPLPQWDEDAMLDGKITFGINSFSDQYMVAIKGNWNKKSTINGQTVSTIDQQASDFTCNLQFQRKTGLFDTLWNFRSLNRDAKTMASDFRLFDCNSAGQKSFNGATKELFSSVGPLRMYVTSTPQQGKEQIRFYLKATDWQITPQGDAQIATYIHAISPKYELPLNFSSYGKQNIDIDFTYSGSTDWQSGNKNLPLDIALNKFNITNLMYNTNTAFHFSNIPSGNNRTSAIAFHSESEFSDQYDALVRVITQNFIKRAYNSNDKKFEKAKPFIQQYTPDQLYSIIYPVIPNFHAMGRLLLALNGSFKGSADSAAGDFVLDGFNLSTTPYGISGAGNMKVVGNATPQGKIQINCANCLKMIDDMFDYASRIQTTLRYFAPDKAAGMTMALDSTKIAAVKNFLSALAAPNSSDNTMLSYNIISADRNVTINGKSIVEIAGLYNQYLAPAFQQAAPTQPQVAPSQVPAAQPQTPAKEPAHGD